MNGRRDQLGSLFLGKFCNLSAQPGEAASRISSEAELSETENMEVSLRVAVCPAGLLGRMSGHRSTEESCGVGPGTCEA